MKTKFPLFLLVLVLSCNQTAYQKETTALKQLLTHLHELPGLPQEGYLMIIPLEGCGSCIQRAVAFARKNMHQPNIRFIVSHYDRQAIKSTFGNYPKGLLVDVGFRAASLGLVTGSPVIYKVENGQVVTVVHLSSENIGEELARLKF